MIRPSRPHRRRTEGPRRCRHQGRRLPTKEGSLQQEGLGGARPRAEPRLGPVVPCQGAGPQQVGEGASKDTPLRRLQGQQGRPPLAPAREKRTRPKLRLRGPPLRKPDTPTCPTRRRPNPRPHPHHPNQPLAPKPIAPHREPPPKLRPVATTPA